MFWSCVQIFFGIRIFSLTGQHEKKVSRCVFVYIHDTERKKENAWNFFRLWSWHRYLVHSLEFIWVLYTPENLFHCPSQNDIHTAQSFRHRQPILCMRISIEKLSPSVNFKSKRKILRWNHQIIFIVWYWIEVNTISTSLTLMSNGSKRTQRLFVRHHVFFRIFTLKCERENIPNIYQSIGSATDSFRQKCQISSSFPLRPLSKSKRNWWTFN